MFILLSASGANCEEFITSRTCSECGTVRDESVHDETFYMSAHPSAILVDVCMKEPIMDPLVDVCMREPIMDPSSVPPWPRTYFFTPCAASTNTHAYT